MKQADISQQLGSLLPKTQSVYNTTNPVGTDIPTEIEEVSIFQVDYDDELSQSNKSALTVLEHIVKSVVPDYYQQSDMIRNKVQIDAFQLGTLYYQQKLNNIVLKTAINQLAAGDTQARLYEVIDKLSKRALELSEQITDLHNQFRKYYIDSYLDLQSKEQAEEAEKQMLESRSSEPNKIENIEQANGNYKFSDSKNMIKHITELRKKQILDEHTTK